MNRNPIFPYFFFWTLFGNFWRMTIVPKDADCSRVLQTQNKMLNILIKCFISEHTSKERFVKEIYSKETIIYLDGISLFLVKIHANKFLEILFSSYNALINILFVCFFNTLLNTKRIPFLLGFSLI